MNINFTPEAELQLNIIGETGGAESGFLFGRFMGKQIIVEQLFPLGFTENTIDDIYPVVINKKKHRVIGVFFNNRNPFFNDWFLEDIVITISRDDSGFRPDCFLYDTKRQDYIRLPISLQKGGTSQNGSRRKE